MKAVRWEEGPKGEGCEVGIRQGESSISGARQVSGFRSSCQA